MRSGNYLWSLVTLLRLQMKHPDFRKQHSIGGLTFCRQGMKLEKCPLRPKHLQTSWLMFFNLNGFVSANVFGSSIKQMIKKILWKITTNKQNKGIFKFLLWNLLLCLGHFFCGYNYQVSKLQPWKTAKANGIVWFKRQSWFILISYISCIIHWI